ncbi:MAG TPA: sulfite exporter TauE/SafE family protein [candidate division Zixibacteria bacterium]|nr:sulfite exporter TauE/SafE family protein [candidate division Zixibacteria bacterium]
MASYWELLSLVPLGFFAGGYGALIGAGGGFVLAPALLLLYPDDPPETITSISLAVVFFNALSGTLVYARSKRIAYSSGLIFALATMPGAVAGALATTAVGRSWFDLLFGSLLVLVAVLSAASTGKRAAARIAQAQPRAGAIADMRPATLALGAALSTVFGFLSSFLGIGGGFLYVPALVYLLGFPVHVATATSLFVLTITALTGSATHVLAGLFQQGIRRVLALSVGAVLGAQFGARLSQRIHADWIIRSLSAALALVGARLIVAAL